MTRHLAIGLACILLPFAAHAQATNGTSAGIAPPNASVPHAANGAPASMDADFVRKATIGGMAEVQSGQVAERQSDNQIKDIGKMLVQDHTKANQTLAAIAKRKHITVPTTLDTMHKNQVAALGKETGKSFNNNFLNTQLTEHQTAIALFQQEAAQGTDPDLKSFAQSALPTLQRHLQMIQAAISKPA